MITHSLTKRKDRLEAEPETSNTSNKYFMSQDGDHVWPSKPCLCSTLHSLPRSSGYFSGQIPTCASVPKWLPPAQRYPPFCLIHRYQTGQTPICRNLAWTALSILTFCSRASLAASCNWLKTSYLLSSYPGRPLPGVHLYPRRSRRTTTASISVNQMLLGTRNIPQSP